jgi:Holliday junction resolvase RusA-like endonuclease
VFPNKRTGKKVVVYSQAYESWKNDALRILGQFKYRLKINFPIILQCHFYVDNKKIRDLSNMYEGIADCLVSAGVLADDNCAIVSGHDGSRIFYDKRNPRTDITIYRLDKKELYMTMIQSFKCDGCNEIFTARDEEGNALPVGGVQGAFMEEHLSEDNKIKMKQVDGDFCPTCFGKIIKFIFALAEENKIK